MLFSDSRDNPPLTSAIPGAKCRASGELTSLAERRSRNTVLQENPEGMQEPEKLQVKRSEKIEVVPTMDDDARRGM